MRYLIIPACHFDGWKICKTAMDRSRIAIGIYHDAKREDRFIVTGNVPHIADLSTTLVELMQDWLILNGIPSYKISKLLGGVGTFSEARAACELLRNQEVIVVSSSWYLFSGKPIWQRRAQENNINISFVSVPNTGGLRTIATYFIYGLVIRLAITAGFEGSFEDIITARQQKRRGGFTFNGCG